MTYSPTILCALTADDQLHYVSGSCLQLLGWQPDELVGRAFSAILHPNDQEAVRTACHTARRQLETICFESRCPSLAGSEVVIEWSAFRLSADERLFCVGRDVTGQRQEAQRAWAQDELHRAIAAHSFGMVALLSEDSLYTYVGGTVLQALGYRPEELVGYSPFEFMHPDDVPAAQASWLALRDEPVFTVTDFRFRAANGEWRWMEASITNQLLNPSIRAYTVNSRDITDQKNRTFELAASEQRFRLLFESNQSPAIFQNADGVVLDVNQAYLSLLKLNRDQVMYQPLLNALPAAFSHLCDEHFRTALSGQPSGYETQIMKAGVERLLRVAKIPLVVEDKIVGVYTTCLDITEMAAAQRLITQQAAQLHMVLESISDAFLSMDRNLCLTYLNSEGERLLNIKQADALGKNMWEMFPQETESIYNQKYREAQDTGQTVRFETFLKHENRWLELKIYPFTEGISIFFSDVTKRVETEKQLKLLALVAQGTVNSVVITDPAGRVEWVNPSFTKDTGYTLAEMLGKKPGDVLQGPETDPAAVRHFQEGFRAHKPFSVTILNYTKQGHKVWLAIDVTPIFNEAGTLIQYVAIQQNITFRKEVEASQAKMTEELYRHNRDLQQFTYVISHNLRAPLANALGLATLLTKVDRQSPVFDTSLAHLRESMGQADTVLKDLNLVLSIRDKQDMHVPERVVLAEVCQQAVQNMQEALQECGGLVKTNVADDLAVHGNRAYIYSIFYNFLSNSIKYRAEGRTLLIEISSAHNEQGGLTITFTDNGSGFDTVKAGSEVFQLYKRFHTNQRGRGIGLFLVKTHVEALGGTIEIASEVDSGTHFLIHLPTI